MYSPNLLLVFCRCSKILPPCESEVIPLHHIVLTRNTTTSPFKRGPISLESWGKRALPASFPLHPILINSMINSNVNPNAIPRFSTSRSILPFGCPRRPSLVVQLIAAMCFKFGPLHPGTTTVWTKNCALGLSNLAYLHFCFKRHQQRPATDPQRRVHYMWPQEVFQSDLI
jgi:hypothetical protein